MNAHVLAGVWQAGPSLIAMIHTKCEGEKSQIDGIIKSSATKHVTQTKQNMINLEKLRGGRGHNARNPNRCSKKGATISTTLPDNYNMC